MPAAWSAAMASGKIVNSYFAGSGVEMNGGLVGEAGLARFRIASIP